MLRFLSVLALALRSTIVTAQDVPNRAVRIVVPWPPSGNVDITARTIAPALGEALGQQVIVENRAGAAGAIGSAAVAKSPADGYTLLLGSSGTITAGPVGTVTHPARTTIAVNETASKRLLIISP